MRLKRFLRLLALAFMIGLACVLPVPLTFKTKDNLPKHLIEMVEPAKEEDDEECKELF